MDDRAAKARGLVSARQFGVLATLSRRAAGYPFGSVVKYAADTHGCPILLLSGLAVHTRNLAADPKASFTVFAATDGDPLAAARATLIGEVRPVDESGHAEARARYLARHPEAAQYFEFGDFALYRLEVRQVYYVGGFGEMGWTGGSDYTAA